jgi:hypothetical protein
MIQWIKRDVLNLSIILVLLSVTIPGCKDHPEGGASDSHTSHTDISQTLQRQGGVSLLPAEGASVKILSPAANQVFTGDQIPLQFALVKGKHGQHVHAYIDGELMGMFESTKGTLTGVKPGTHMLELRVVTADHNSELDATDKVEFSVRK